MSSPASWRFLVRALSAGLTAGFGGGCLAPGVGKDDAVPAPPMPQVRAAKPGAATVVPSREEILAQAREVLERDDIPAALRVFNVIEDRRERGEAIGEFVGASAREDAMRAARIALALPPGLTQAGAVETAARALAVRDAEAALQWALALPESAPRFTALRAVVDQLVEAGPRAAIDRLTRMTPGARRDEALGLAGARWARREPEGAWDWALELPAGELKTRVATSIGFEIAQTAPDRAIAISNTLPEGRNRWLLLSAIAQTWVAREPRAATTWARQLPPGEAREAALAGIETSLALTPHYPAIPGDRFPRRGRRVYGGQVAPDDLASLPTGADRDRALRNHFNQLLLMSPALAGDWLNSLAPADRTDEMVERLIRDWLPQNAAAAEAWIDQSIVQPDRKRELLRDWRR